MASCGNRGTVLATIYPDKFDPGLCEIARLIADADINHAHNQIANCTDASTRLLAVYRSARVSDLDFAATTGYGYDDGGATVGTSVRYSIRHQNWPDPTANRLRYSRFSSVFVGVLFPGDELVSLTGRPYDTQPGKSV